MRGRFGREARSLAALNHPNVVNIHDSGEHHHSPYIVMQYVRGETLAEKIARKAPFTTGQKLKLMTDQCAGLAHAHEAGIIHRDITPANLMVDHGGRLKLVDFGIARSDVGQTRFGPQVTQVNVRIGTPGTCRRSESKAVRSTRQRSVCRRRGDVRVDRIQGAARTPSNRKQGPAIATSAAQLDRPRHRSRA